MKIHHLNCGTLCPFGGRLINGPPAKIICHCLLIETDSSGLVLIDTGFGTEDIKNPIQRLERPFLKLIRPKLDIAETALSQIEKLGFKKDDVRHIVLTHLDLDHAGGLSDFPHAKVHLYESELSAAMEKKTFLEKKRYHSIQWGHGPKWQTYRTQGEKWFGFDRVTQLQNLPPEILMIPLIGHTRGHCGIAVQNSNGWLLLAGDAYFYMKEMNYENPKCTIGLRIFQKILAHNNSKRIENQTNLRRLAHNEGSVKVFSSHDPEEFKQISRNL